MAHNLENTSIAPENRFATITDLQELLNTVRGDIARLDNDRQAMLSSQEAHNEIQRLQEENIQLRKASTRQQAVQVNTMAAGTKEPKVSLPEKFDGTRSKFRGFVQQVKLFLRLSPSQYSDDFTKVGLIGTLLSGSALAWFAPLMERNSPLLNNFDDFLKAFSATFGDGDRERVAETKIQSLQQGSRSAAIYASEFQQLTCDLDWNDKALINRFRYGLKDDVKDLLLTMPKVDTLEDFITQSIACDNRLFERRQEQRLGWRGPRQSMLATSSKFIENRPKGPEPMQIDTTQFKRLTPEEKERRRREDLCLYCGKPGHKAQDCRLKPNGFKARSMTTNMEESGNEGVQSQ